MNFSDHHNPKYQEFLFDLQKDTNTDFGARSKLNAEIHAKWIFQSILDSTPAQILDIGCGIGLYSHALAKLGCKVTGVDISGYAIDYASKNSNFGSNCVFITSDILEIKLEKNYDLIIFPYSVFNLFNPLEREKFLNNISQFLKSTGTFYFEVLRDLKNKISQIFITYENPDLSLLYPDIELIVNDHNWDENTQKLKIRTYTITQSKTVHKNFLEIHYYSHSDYKTMLNKHGFKQVNFLENPPGTLGGSGIFYESIMAKL